jgi:hypothetical protein
MFQSICSPINGFFRRQRLKNIAKQVRAGIVPKDVSREEVFEALRTTRPKGALEMFGLLSAKHHGKDGKLVKDLGLVGVRKVTREFAELLADAMTTSGDEIDTFNAHAQGDGSTAEASTDQALVSQEDGRNLGTQSLGSTSNVYRSVATITASSAYTVIEHGIFNQTSVTGDYLLDRTVINSFTVATDDEVEWTYELTINTETV